MVFELRVGRFRKSKSGKGIPKPTAASLWHTAARKRGIALLLMASRPNEFRDQTSHSRKQQTARSGSAWTLMAQSPKTSQGGASLLIRCDYHPWRRRSLYGLSLQPDDGDGSSHPCWTASRGDIYTTMPSSSEIQWACYKKWKLEWESQTRMCQMFHLRNSRGCTALDMPEWREHEQAARLAGKATITGGLITSRKIWSVEELETLSAGTKPSTSHHWSPGGERPGKRKRWTIFLERMRHWKYLKAKLGKTSERCDGAHMGLVNA